MLQSQNPDLGTAGSFGSRDPFIAWATIRRTLIGVAFFTSTFLLFPYTLHIALGDKLETWHLLLLLFCFFCIMITLFGRALAKDNKARSEMRKYQREKEEVMDGIYRCVSPQILGSMVVFPIVVQDRDAERDSILTLTDEKMVVQLAQGGKVGPPLSSRDGEEGMRKREVVMKKREKDTIDRLTALISTAINAYNVSKVVFGIKIFSGTGAGPTGLSAGVSSPGYGATLAAYVGSCLEKAAVPIASPPVIESGQRAKAD